MKHRCIERLHDPVIYSNISMMWTVKVLTSFYTRITCGYFGLDFMLNCPNKCISDDFYAHKILYFLFLTVNYCYLAIVSVTGMVQRTFSDLVHMSNKCHTMTYTCIWPYGISAFYYMATRIQILSEMKRSLLDIKIQ